MLVVRAVPKHSLRHLQEVVWVSHPKPLAMQGGDPYIRALMRTISAAESNTSEPYSILYGGESFNPIHRHPNICVKIVAGPNTGKCTTAAGRYQFLTQTWEEKARKYHPRPPAWYQVWSEYSFDPESQDMVVYQWLKDSSAWGLDISDALRQGRLEEVLKRLSGTWTSLGYGIESNSMTARLPRIYRNLLEEELQNAPSGALPSPDSL
ncbi:MAG TPA: glycoside hydrolase family protein [Leptolyngbyaceae cyanobacterium M65_K2018_010]|nr:glycoside hydrolase family protein [Leptolyngbyaceae cyanobacterium M65_K2018_010]